MINEKLRLTIAIVLVSAAAVLFLQNRGSEGQSTPDTLDARTRGPENAPIQIVEFIDFECAQCAEGAALIREFTTRYSDQVRVRVYYFPIPTHQHGMTAAIAVECAAQQGAFWPMHDRLLQQQDSWTQAENVDTLLREYAQELGLDPQRFLSCLQNKQTRIGIEQERQWGRQSGVRSTPSYVINGETVVGPHSLRRVLQRLERELLLDSGEDQG